jgi:hypothetical protein
MGSLFDLALPCWPSVGFSSLQKTPVHFLSSRIVGVRKALASVFVQFFRFIDQLDRDLGTLGVPLSQ